MWYNSNCRFSGKHMEQESISNYQQGGQGSDKCMDHKEVLVQITA